MNIKPIESETIHNKVYEELLAAILSGRVPPGERITIEGIATIMNVSLMPVRLALQKLEAGGFVTVGKNRRFTVSELTPENLVELLEIRLLLECRAAETACRIRSETSLKELEKLHKRCTNAPDEDTYLEANRQFHAVIYREARMPILEEIIGSLWNRASPYLHILLRSEQEWESDKFNRHHQGMLDAMHEKDPVKICKWLTEDLTEAAKLVKGRLEKERGNKE